MLRLQSKCIILLGILDMRKLVLYTLLSVLLNHIILAGGRELPDLFEETHFSISDTIPVKNVKNGSGDEQDTNPFDLKDPKIIENTIEYDAESGEYRTNQKIGSEFYRPSSYMSFDEYMKFKSRQQDKEYMKSLAGISTSKKTNIGVVDPVTKIEIKRNLADRLFGGLGIQIEPKGSVDLTLGGYYNFNDIPNLSYRQKRNYGPKFDMDIQMEVVGNIGDKLKLNTSLNTQSSFDFENKIKLNYDSEKFSEDDIIKKIEAGNVSLPLRSTLIQGSQNLFGFKTDWQFGHLRLTGIVSQQKSKQESIKTKGGGVVQDFVIRPDNYDENRNFFLSHYNRNTYEEALAYLPEINSQFKIKDLEVWITEDVQNSRETEVRDIVALTDLGVPDGLPFDMDSLNFNKFIPGRAVPRDLNGRPLVTNTSNSLLDKILSDTLNRELNKVVGVLSDPAGLNLQQGRDFEKVRAKRLNSTEYTYNADLGFISLRIRPRPNQILAVSYHYTYNGKQQDPRTGANFKVGEFSSEIKSDSLRYRVLFTKLLKSSSQSVTLPSYDLMMKNVYPIGGYNLNQTDFNFDIFYESKDGIAKRFIPEIDGYPLLNLFRLDNLNKSGDPQPDGVFDWVPAQTIIPATGSVIFPVLEPFGSSLKKLLSNVIIPFDQAKVDSLFNKYSYQELYNSSLTTARQNLQSNQFLLKGNFKSGKSNEISLNTFSSDPNLKIIVKAGALALVEGVDYTVDRNLGKVTILNDAYLQGDASITVDFENNSLFSFQTKTMLGLRAEYSKRKDFYVGTTYMRLFEKPYTQKVNLGDDPINNTIYGIDFGLNKSAPWLTRALDKLPLYSTKEDSKWSLQAEAALLQPGHSRAINQTGSDGGVIYIDDFEGSATGIGLFYNPTQWLLASAPLKDSENSAFRGVNSKNDLYTSANRALLSWYRIDDYARTSNQGNDSYSRIVQESDIFPNRQRPIGYFGEVTFDLTYYPREKGPYNYDIPNGLKDSLGNFITAGINDKYQLNSPETRWGGIMSKLNTNDFEANNVEYIDFWVLNPFLSKFDNSPISNSGKLILQLGNFSEDIFKDGYQQFENGLPTSNLNLPISTTNFGRISRKPPITGNFDNDNRSAQDIGFDGLNSINTSVPNGELSYFSNYVEKIRGFVAANILDSIAKDPSNDDYLSYRSSKLDNEPSIIKKYKRYNMPEGNAQIDPGNNISTAYTNTPDQEDVNNDKSLNELESYYNYPIDIVNDNNQINIASAKFITETINPVSNPKETWYHFRIPINQYKDSVGQISDFRSIQSMRLLLTGFDEEVTFRMIKFQLGRNTWRRYVDKERSCIIDAPDEALILDKVDIEENSGKLPFNYVVPKGIDRERFYGTTAADLFQNESSLLLRKNNFLPNCEQSVYKIIDLDIRKYKRVKLFVHGESSQDLNPGDAKVFLRFGKDFTNNYYEYEIPLRLSNKSVLPGNTTYVDSVWLAENEFDFPLQLLVDLKNKRGVLDSFSMADPDKPSNRVTIKGNPTIGLVRGVQMGMRNSTNQAFTDLEVWFNELRLIGLDEKGGFATVARGELQLADLGSISMAGNYSTVGWGGLDQKLDQRALDEILQYDATTTLELGKFIPKKVNIALPFSAQYSSGTRTPQYDPNDTDVKLKDKLNSAAGKSERDSIKDRAIDYAETRSFAFNNVRRNKTGNSKAKPWDIENISLSYGQSTSLKHNPVVSEDKLQTKQGSIDYNFSLTPKYIEPFKKIVKNKNLKIISDFNFNLIPNSLSVRNNLDRKYGKRVYRFAAPKYSTWEDVKFGWGRDYTLNWDFTRLLKFNFTAQNDAIVDEITYNPLKQGYINPLTNRVASVEDKKPFVRKNISNFGRTKDYRHTMTLSYSLPTRSIPFLDWIQVRGQYAANYSWSAGSLNSIDTLGSVIGNGQNLSVSGEFNLVNFYNKIKYFKKINGENSSTGRFRNSQNRTPVKPSNKKDKLNEKDKQQDTPRELSILEKVVVRPLLLVRKIQLNYAENRSTIIPGFMQNTELLGMNKSFSAPGWDFVAGFQPDFSKGKWLDQAAAKGWISPNKFFSREMIQRKSTTGSAKLKLELFKEFNIDLNIDRNYVKDHTEAFKRDEVFGTPDFAFQHFTPFDNGQYTITYISVQTLFNKDIDKVFEEFSNNRTKISKRIGDQYGITNPSKNSPQYRDGFLGDHQDVILPAFLATYTKTDPDKVNLNVFKTIPLPNWQINYTGLSRLGLMKNLFQDFSIRHAYSNKMSMNSYRTNLDYKEDQNGLPTTRKQDTLNGSYFAKLEIPEVSINESFSPLIGVNIKTKGGIELGLDVNRNRNLQLKSAIDGQLDERNTKNYTFKAGYVLKNVYLNFLPGVKKEKKLNKKSKKKKGDPLEETAIKPKGNDMQFNLDIGIQDDITKIHVLDDNTKSQVINGSKTISISPSVLYNVNKNLNLKIFLDYRKQTPYASGQYKTLSYNGGITIQFLLN